MSAHRVARGARVVAVSAVVAVVSVVAGCELRAALAQSELFASFRPELIRECCACLAANTTTDEGATCNEARLQDGVVGFDSDAVFGSPDDETTDVDETVRIPCLCGASRLSCTDALEVGEEVLIPGACVDQVDAQAPCETACAGVLSFDSIQ